MASGTVAGTWLPPAPSQMTTSSPPSLSAAKTGKWSRTSLPRHAETVLFMAAPRSPRGDALLVNDRAADDDNDEATDDEDEDEEDNGTCAAAPELPAPAADFAHGKVREGKFSVSENQRRA